MFQWLRRAQRPNEAEWRRVYELVEKVKTPHEASLYLIKGYTAHDLRIDLLAAIPDWAKTKR